MSQLYTLLGMLAGAGTVLLGFLKFRPERDLAVAQTAKELIDPLREQNRELTVRLEDALERIAVLEALMANAGVTLPASLVRTRRDQRSDDQSHQEGT